MGRFIALMLLIAAPSLAAASEEIRLLTINGVINPVTSRYLKRELRDAARSEAGAVVVTLDSPGGLGTSMREMVEEMLASPVPVVTFVSPPGARAASAGMFVTVAAHVAAMAPGTNIGAAHPLVFGAREEPTRTTEQEKILNDTAALARSIAAERGRNADWAEEAVRKSVSITAAEALKLGVIDLRAVNLPDLLRKLNGRVVETSAGRVTLRPAEWRVVERPMTFPERLLQALTDPNIAFILLTLGLLGIIAEFFHPGMILPGALGVLCLLLGYVALGSLPINWVGLILIVSGIGFLIAELHVPTLGALGTIGLVCFLLGSLMLYRPLTPASPTLPQAHVSPAVLAAMALLVAGFFFGVLRAAWRVRRRPVTAGPETLVGTSAFAESDLDPTGIVNLRGERWSAEAVPGKIRAGEPVEVLGVKGVTLRVRRA